MTSPGNTRRSSLLAALVCCGLLAGTGCATGTATPSTVPATSTNGTPAAGRTTGTATTAATATTEATATSATVTKSLSGKVIVIDPGHNGGWTKAFGYRKVPDGNGGRKNCNSSGTATRSGYSEHAYNWAQAKALAKVLRARGATVRLTRTSDTGKGPCVNKRADLANKLKADLLISLHADGNTGRSHRGFHIIVSTVMHGGTKVIKKSKRLAANLRSALQKKAGLPRSNYIGKGTGYSFRSDLATLNFAKRPAVMIEMGNMFNSKDAKLFTSASWRKKAATALASGITAYLS